MRENLIKQFSRTITPQSQRHILYPKHTQGLYLKFSVRKLIISWASHCIINTDVISWRKIKKTISRKDSHSVEYL